MDTEVTRDDDGRCVAGAGQHEVAGKAAPGSEEDKGEQGLVTEIATTTEGIEVIQSDVRQLLSEMQATFKSASQSVLNKIDVMQGKIGELEKSVASLTATVEQESSGSVDDYHGAQHQRRHRINQE